MVRNCVNAEGFNYKPSYNKIQKKKMSYSIFNITKTEAKLLLNHMSERILKINIDNFFSLNDEQLHKLNLICK